MFLYVLAVVPVLLIGLKIRNRLRLSLAKHPSLRGHSKWSRRVASQIPFFSYDEKHFFACDGAPEEVAKQRQESFTELAARLRESMAEDLDFTKAVYSSISDVRFTHTYRIPFPFREVLNKEIKSSTAAVATRGVKVRDLDGNWRYDLAGSYGLNVFGYDFYKECMERGFEKVKQLGPVLGPYHPLIRENVEKLKAISGLDEVSFHMSGTEAVMQAVRLARYHTGRKRLVRFCGAYHGWWDGVQPGVGNRRNIDDVYTLSDLSETTLRVLETRRDIACVLINPMQAMHPNSDAPGDATLIASDRAVSFDRARHTEWLHRVRDACQKAGIVLIFDEVFTGFRLDYRGAQQYFGIQADMVTYGKTLGGGLPLGIVCGRSHLMKRFKDDRPIDVSLARGTFNSHPYLLGAMHEFLTRIESPEFQQLYRYADALWNHRVTKLNARLVSSNVPVQVVNMHTVLTVIYQVPSRYNWMFQFYLRAEGLELSWTGTGRMIMSLNYTDQDFADVTDRFVMAGIAMRDAGWWWQSENLTNKWIRRQVLREMLAARIGWSRRTKTTANVSDAAKPALEHSGG